MTAGTIPQNNLTDQMIAQARQVYFLCCLCYAMDVFFVIYNPSNNFNVGSILNSLPFFKIYIFNVELLLFRRFPSPSLSWLGFLETGTVRDTVYPLFIVFFPPYVTLPVQVCTFSFHTLSELRSRGPELQ
jgi:hypothetical protein